MDIKTTNTENVATALSEYIAEACKAELPDGVIEKAKHHTLDTLAAAVSGSKLKPGELAIQFVKTQEGARESQVIGSSIITSAINAAFANAMMAHADETDDTHAGSLTHPGCAVVPAALALAEKTGASGKELLNGIVAG